MKPIHLGEMSNISQKFLDILCMHSNKRLFNKSLIIFYALKVRRKAKSEIERVSG